MTKILKLEIPIGEMVEEAKQRLLPDKQVKIDYVRYSSVDKSVHVYLEIKDEQNNPQS